MGTAIVKEEEYEQLYALMVELFIPSLVPPPPRRLLVLLEESV